jgi:hypothetical protein
MCNGDVLAFVPQQRVQHSKFEIQDSRFEVRGVAGRFLQPFALAPLPRGYSSAPSVTSKNATERGLRICNKIT